MLFDDSFLLMNIGSALLLLLSVSLMRIQLSFSNVKIKSLKNFVIGVVNFLFVFSLSWVLDNEPNLAIARSFTDL
jgi:hypothetical protein